MEIARLERLYVQANISKSVRHSLRQELGTGGKVQPGYTDRRHAYVRTGIHRTDSTHSGQDVGEGKSGRKEVESTTLQIP